MSQGRTGLVFQALQFVLGKASKHQHQPESADECHQTHTFLNQDRRSRSYDEGPDRNVIKEGHPSVFAPRS